MLWRRPSWIMAVGELVAALGILTILGSAIGYVIEASTTAASAKSGVERNATRIDTIMDDVHETREDVQYIRGVIEAQQRQEKQQ